MLTCKCPAAEALETIPAVKCSENFGQIQKVAFQRLTKADGTRNSFDSAASIKKKASWTPLLTAADSTKVVVSPYIEAPTSEAGEPTTAYGGNDSLNGIEVIIGRNPTSFSAVIRKAPQSVIKALKALECEATGDLGVFLFNANGDIEAIKDESSETYYPIPIQSFFVSDKTHGGLEAFDSNNIQWAFPQNFSDNLVIVTPEDFNPLTDLVPAV